jgi:hypothetical protein
MDARRDIPDGATYRFKVTLTIGPTDRPMLDVFRWCVAMMTDAHANARFPVSVKVEPMRPDD